MRCNELANFFNRLGSTSLRPLDPSGDFSLCTLRPRDIGFNDLFKKVGLTYGLTVHAYYRIEARNTEQSVTYRYRELPVSGICHFFCGIGTGIGKIWYRKKVLEPVLLKFGIGKSLGTGIGNI